MLGDAAYAKVGTDAWASEQAVISTDLIALEEDERGFEALLRREPSRERVAE